jgi:hypothetical protein
MMPIDPILVVGVVLLLLGWLAIPLAVSVFGWLIGIMGGIMLIDYVVIHFPQQHLPEWSYLLAAGVLGFLGWVIAKKLFYVLIFLGGVFGALTLKGQLDMVYNLTQELTQTPLGSFAQTPWFTMIVGLAGGALLSLLRRYLLILLSSLAGAILIARTAQMEQKILILVLVGIGFQTLCCTLRPGKLFFRKSSD